MAVKVVVTKKDIEKYPNNYDLGSYIREKFVMKKNKSAWKRFIERWVVMELKN